MNDDTRFRTNVPAGVGRGVVPTDGTGENFNTNGRS